MVLICQSNLSTGASQGGAACRQRLGPLARTEGCGGGQDHLCFMVGAYNMPHSDLPEVRSYFLHRISSTPSAKINIHGHTMWCWPMGVVCHHEPTSQQWAVELQCNNTTSWDQRVNTTVLHIFTISLFLFKQCKQQTRQYFTSNTLLTLATQRYYHLANDSGMFPMNVDDFQRYN